VYGVAVAAAGSAWPGPGGRQWIGAGERVGPTDMGGRGRRKGGGGGGGGGGDVLRSHRRPRTCSGSGVA